LADVLLNRPIDSTGPGIIFNTDRDLLMYDSVSGIDIILGFGDSDNLLITSVAGGGASQSSLDSANALIVTLRASLDSAENASGGGSTNAQRWIA
tara:strand:+ start:4207 stop:4491 length:285 start_codon:yes stop_codon:yes gene_type:complete